MIKKSSLSIRYTEDTFFERTHFFQILSEKKGEISVFAHLSKLTPLRQDFSNYLKMFDDHELFTMTFGDKTVVKSAK